MWSWRSHDKLKSYLHHHSGLPNLAGWWLTLMGFDSWSHMTLWSRGFVKSRDNLKSYLHYHSDYGHQTWQAGESPWGASPHVTHPLVPLYNEIFWQTKTIMSLLSQYLWPQHWGGWWLTLTVFYSKIQMTM